MLSIKADELPRFMTCNASRLMSALVPPQDDFTARDEGTAAHHMATQVFNGHHTLEELIDRKAPNGVYMTSEMAQHVATYLTAISGTYSFAGMEIDTSHDRSPHWVVNGRCDWIGESRLSGDLNITDFKYGWRIVEPERNWTLISHAIGRLSQSGAVWNVQRINFNIYQPRPHHPDGPLRTWSITYPELTALYAEMNTALSAPSDQLVTSPHCHRCHALVSCPAARQAEMNAIDVSLTAYEDTIDNATLSFNLDNLFRAQKMLEDRLKAFQELAKHRIQGGQVVDNYSVDLNYGHTAWKEGINAQALKVITGRDLSVEKLVTPAEAKRRGVDETTIKTLTERPMIGVKLERVKADKKAARIFKQAKEN